MQMGDGSQDGFQDLMLRLRNGDQAAAGEVFNRFVCRLVALARSQLDTWMRDRTDPEDVVQSVYKSFFTRFTAGQFDVASWESLWGLLALITVRKCANQAKHFQAGRRDFRREAAQGRVRESSPLFDAVDRDPGPLEAAVLTETLECLLSSLDERGRLIVQLHLQGHEIPAISLQVERSQRTVRRALELARRQLEEAFAQQSSV
jgi:RNA polymerase sigma-70 factor (ECF subfamily)